MEQITNINGGYVRIEDWYCTSGYYKSDFTLPEDEEIKIGGIVFGHAYIQDGSYIKTQIIKEWEKKNKVVTIDGVEWELGAIDELYEEFLKNEQIDN